MKREEIEQARESCADEAGHDGTFWPAYVGMSACPDARKNRSDKLAARNETYNEGAESKTAVDVQWEHG
jgi:hypothetical protein